MFGRCVVYSAMLRGVEAVSVSVEVALTQGLPGVFIVGMADAAVQESRERVKIAIRSSGFTMPNERIVVNLAPSSLKKSGSGFDLAIAVGILIATGQVDPVIASDALLIGELSLDGGVKPVNGLLAYALHARDMGLALTCSEDTYGLMEVPGARLRGLGRLSDLRYPRYREIHHLRADNRESPLDFGDVAGHEMAKRALQIAACGNHGLLMMGPPGSGKTMLASRVPSILPELTPDQILESALVHSVAGENLSQLQSGIRPFRAPHHSATGPGLVGGGKPVRPGEISLTHNGILFLDELPEFRPSVLQQLRQPMESGMVTITRAEGAVTFPASFVLIAAANPCPCGYFGDEDNECTCTSKQVHDYQARIGGPLIDRIDLHIDVNRVPVRNVIGRERGTTSETLRTGVMEGREYASWRMSRNPSAADAPNVIESCLLSEEDERFFERTATAAKMSGRAIVRTLAVARTIADMAQVERVGKDELCEALGFRVRAGIGGAG